ncbi:preprotein translocase subunit SecE [Acaryochloris sp. 'Moss Beach']|nr:preprotein translocase subunit SecE [Acaryochloris marina S15]UJB71965.1 preprotein translocase subunit SecE [Acaryochloris sp. 'Moss Beach']
MAATTADTGESLESSSSTPERAAVAATSSAAGSTSFFQSTKEEFEKVVWPDRQQLISESIAVFLMVSLSAIIFSFIDNLFRWVSTLVFG